jgi:hypothetical protein
METLLKRHVRCAVQYSYKLSGIEKSRGFWPVHTGILWHSGQVQEFGLMVFTGIKWFLFIASTGFLSPQVFVSLNKWEAHRGHALAKQITLNREYGALNILSEVSCWRVLIFLGG